MNRTLLLAATAMVAGISGSIAALGCGAEGDEESLDEAAVSTGPECTVFSASLKRNLTAEELAALGDPIARKVLRGEGCPTTLNEITAKLERTDNVDCRSTSGFGGSSGIVPPILPPLASSARVDASAPPPAGAGPAGVTTRLVNDSVFLTGEPGGAYRAVMTRDCEGRARSDLFVSIFGLSPSDGELPQEQTELVGMDRTTGVFDFYVRESRENRWVFMGSSKDAIAQGYDCDEHGACIPKAAKDARCWACHESGGVNMKELHSPWNSWNLDRGMPGHDEVFRKFGKQLGKPETGIDLELRVETGNQAWNRTRLEASKARGAAEVLRPLFCTLTVNLEDFGGATDIDQVPGNFLAGNLAFAFIPVDPADYRALLEKNNQRITDGQRPLESKSGVVRDAQNAFRFPSKGQIDLDYLGELIRSGVVDERFVEDVENVDFTRPVFSKARCDLLAFAPKLEGADLTTAKIRQGFIENLKAASTPAAAALLKNLQTPGGAGVHQVELDAFFSACKQRPAKEFLADALLVLSHERRALRAHRGRQGARADQGIIEFPETLPVDDLPDTTQAFGADCTLK